MLTKGNVFLIGPMGSGKTAVGRHLARMLRFTFYDSDADIEAKTGVDVAFNGHAHMYQRNAAAQHRSLRRHSGLPRPIEPVQPGISSIL